jgi:hypothetical protein
MVKRQVRSVKTALTEEDRIRHRAIREEVEKEKDELMAQGRAIKARHSRLREALQMLKAARKALGLGLADIKQHAGIEKGNLSRLENAPMPDPTVDCLTRYADAVGTERVITLVDKAGATSNEVR